MILGISHDTCLVCGKDIQMRKGLKLYHHGHPARPCPGAGQYGVRIDRFIKDQAAKLKAAWGEQSDGEA